MRLNLNGDIMNEKWLKAIMILFSLYIICDGIGSILIYNHQTFIEHVPRTIRTIIGLMILFLNIRR